MSELKTCFKRVDYDLSGLLHYIDIGDIGLPDIQRPFVWPNSKVRDLFDSMYKGFPVGYLLFWENGVVGGAKPIGTAAKQHNVPSRLIVDGQQRLTSLFAVFRGHKVLDETTASERSRSLFARVTASSRSPTRPSGVIRSGYRTSPPSGHPASRAIRWSKGFSRR